MYIGPGAGFAFLGSFLSLVSAVVAGILSVVLWPFRMAWLLFMRPRRARVRKAIFLGFEGLDPAVTEQLMSEGKLPNLARLSYRRLRTTNPALPAVAWATFATGVNPGMHRVFGAAAVERKGDSFWKILGQHAVKSTILLVPGASASERFYGRLLADPPAGFYASYLTKLLGPVAKREEFLFSALDNTRRGVVACVFDSDRDLDRIVGETLARVDAETALFVLSDGARREFRPAVDLNAWLEREGYRSRAYAAGPAGICVNRKVVSVEEARVLRKELIAKLTGLVDVYEATDIYRGPYVSEAPDLVIGYAPLVPGVLFSNLRITADDPGMEDIAPTVLGLFGVEAPAWMEGRSVIASA
jgi:predicted AlkP superfamily phosphohydrolase/phosphomutase